MTELEIHLLNALEQLQQDYMQRLSEWESAFVELQKMFSLTQRDNAMLNERVMQLSQQVQHLSEQTGVSLDIENYCTLRLLFNQSLVLDKVPEYGKPAKCCSP
ncbi:TPA: MbeD family mobilization/exclusion protein [Escherichia coli]